MAGHERLLADLTRRGLLQRASAAALALSMANAPRARAQSPADPDGTLQAFADTMLPGRRMAVTEAGAAIHPQAIAGVDGRPGAGEADALAPYPPPEIGFDALEPAFLADLEAIAVQHGGPFLSLGWD